MLSVGTAAVEPLAVFTEDAVRTAIEAIAERCGSDFVAAAVAVEVIARRISIESITEREGGWV